MIEEMLAQSPLRTEEDCRKVLDRILALSDEEKVNLWQDPAFVRRFEDEEATPDSSLPRITLDFYKVLFILAAQPQADGDWVRSLAGDAHFRSQPQVLRQLAVTVVHSSERLAETLRRITHLEMLLDRERQGRPDGIKKSTRYLLRQVKRRMMG